MRKTLSLTTLMTAAVLTTMSVSESSAFQYREGYRHYGYFKKKPPAPAPRPAEQHSKSADTTGYWVGGCFAAAAGSLMIGSAVRANDKDDPRQLTINEAGWHAVACPLFLPWALMVQATCPDNNATKQVARLAFRYLQKRQAGDQSPFTAAYGEACRTGKLSPQTLAQLNSLI
jgi:hypothetical protein